MCVRGWVRIAEHRMKSFMIELPFGPIPRMTAKLKLPKGRDLIYPQILRSFFNK